MPNHVINILSFEGDKTKIRQMLEDIKDDECGLHSVDFNKIIPMPPGLDLEAGSCTQAGLDAYRDFYHRFVTMDLFFYFISTSFYNARLYTNSTFQRDYEKADVKRTVYKST